jgi:hypothetical protein
MGKKKKDVENVEMPRSPEPTITYREFVPESAKPVTVYSAPAPLPAPPAPPPAPKEILTLEMYLSRKKIPQRNLAGMRAFTKVVRASFPEWEQIFSQY